MSGLTTPDDFRPTATREVLERRAQLLRALRQHFDGLGYCEVETPLLSHDTVIDRHLHPFSVNCPPFSHPLYLQTSPEFGMKRLLVAGAQRIYQITRAFRQEESGSSHNPEFTMLEWYQAGGDYEAGLESLAGLCRAVLPGREPRRLSYVAAFETHAGFDPLRISDDDLRKHVGRTWPGQACEALEFDRDYWLNWVLVHQVQPHLGVQDPEIVFDWPASQAALARTRACTDGILVAERFELYIDREEIANGYHELLDANELRRRNRWNNDWRRRSGYSVLPEESRLLAAMDVGLPACMGVALGVDRLLMKILGLNHLREVLAFPIERA